MSGDTDGRQQTRAYRSDSDKARIALLENEVVEYDGRLEGAIATLSGEADELAYRRPHPDAHLYDVEEQLRWKADQLTDWRDERELPRI